MTQATVSAKAQEPSHMALRQAAEWYARLRDGKASAQARMDWQQWLHAAEENQTAWQYVEHIGRGFEPLRNTHNPRQIAHGLCAANDRLQARRRVLAGMAVLAGGGLLGWLGWQESLLPSNLMAWSADYRTLTGEQREILLSDGSRVWLNTATAINVHFDTSERRIQLISGEIFIETAQDALPPFLVETTQGRLRALGTRFNVRMEGGETRLAVYSGAVEIRTSTNAATSIIPAGHQADFTEDHVAAGEPVDMARKAWIRGTLAADNIPLGEVVQELRRYRKGYLGVADEIADLKVYGNFPIRDTDLVLHMLATALPIRIERPMPWWASIEARHQP